MRHETALKETKVQLRMRAIQKDVIARAAAVRQTTVTNFMVEQAFQAAQQILADQTHFISPRRSGMSSAPRWTRRRGRSRG